MQGPRSRLHKVLLLLLPLHLASSQDVTAGLDSSSGSGQVLEPVSTDSTGASPDITSELTTLDNNNTDASPTTVISSNTTREILIIVFGIVAGILVLIVVSLFVYAGYLAVKQCNQNKVTVIKAKKSFKQSLIGGQKVTVTPKITKESF